MPSHVSPTPQLPSRPSSSADADASLFSFIRFPMRRHFQRNTKSSSTKTWPLSRLSSAFTSHSRPSTEVIHQQPMSSTSMPNPPDPPKSFSPQTEAELWDAAVNWVRQQVIVTFRHRAILSRLQPVMDGIPKCDVSQAMLSIELPSSTAMRNVRFQRAPTSSGESVEPLYDGRAPSFVAAPVIARNPSVTSVERMVEQVRARIQLLDEIETEANELSSRKKFYKRTNTPTRRQPSGVSLAITRTPPSSTGSHWLSQIASTPKNPPSFGSRVSRTLDDVPVSTN